MSFLLCCCCDSGFVYWCPALKRCGAVLQLLLSNHFNEHDIYTTVSDLNSIYFSNLLFLFNSVSLKGKLCWVVEDKHIFSFLLLCPFFIQNGTRWMKFHLLFFFFFNSYLLLSLPLSMIFSKATKSETQCHENQFKFCSWLQ